MDAKNEMDINTLEIDETQMVNFFEGNTWIDSAILDSPPKSDLANKSQRFPSFSNNKYLQMFLEATTEDIYGQLSGKK